MLETINNGEGGLIVRGKLNRMFEELYNGTAVETFAALPEVGDTKLVYFVKDTETFYTWNGTLYLAVNINLPNGALTNDVSGGTGWDAATNTPLIISGEGNEGDFAVVSVAGTTEIDGISIWAVGDYIWFDTANFVWRKVDNQNEQEILWAASKFKSGEIFDSVACFDEGGAPYICETQTSALYVGDYVNDFPSLQVASNWVNNIASLPGTLGDRAIGIDELGSISESFYTQYGWARDFINPFITDVALIASLETPANWTKVSDIIAMYDAAKGDKGQAYYSNGIFFICLGNVTHTWLRYGELDTQIISDVDYITKPLIEVNKADNDTFEIASKYDIEKIVVEAETAISGIISIGTSDGLSDIVANTPLPTVPGQKKKLALTFYANLPTDTATIMYVNIDSAATVKLHILTKKCLE